MVQIKGLSLYGIFLIVIVLISAASAQITFSRQWVRGKYPGDSDGGESPEFQRAAKAIYPLRDSKRAFPRFLKSDYVPILVNTHVLEDIFEKMKEPPIATGPISLENAKK